MRLKDALEHSAEYFREYEQNKTLAQLVDTQVPGYNFDVAQGVSYDIDLTKPIGQRIQNLKFKGQPLSPTQKLKVVTNNYRVNGAQVLFRRLSVRPSKFFQSAPGARRQSVDLN